MVVRRWAAALIALPLLVSCSEDEPSSDPVEPTSSVASEPSETPTGPVEPVMPEAAKKMTKAGAIAFVKYYWAMVGHAQSTGATDELAALASENCDACGGGVKAIRRVYANGGEVRGRSPHLRSVRASLIGAEGGASQTTAHVRFEAEVPPTVEYFRTDDARNKRWPGGVTTGRFFMSWQVEPESWIVMDWDVL